MPGNFFVCPIKWSWCLVVSVSARREREERNEVRGGSVRRRRRRVEGLMNEARRGGGAVNQKKREGRRHRREDACQESGSEEVSACQKVVCREAVEGESRHLTQARSEGGRCRPLCRRSSRAGRAEGSVPSVREGVSVRRMCAVLRGVRRAEERGRREPEPHDVCVVGWVLPHVRCVCLARKMQDRTMEQRVRAGVCEMTGEREPTKQRGRWHE
jgi:hypothetical protein